MSPKRLPISGLILAVALAACSARGTSPPEPHTPAATVHPTAAETTTPRPTDTPATTATGPTLTLAPATELLDTASIHSIPLQSITQGGDPNAIISMDDQFIYLVGFWQSGSLYRIPLKGGDPEKIAVTKYAGGRLDLFQPIVTGNWIVFGDTPATLQGISGRWLIRAVNLSDFSERAVAESENDPLNSITLYSLAGEAGKVYWTRELLKKDGLITEVTLSMLNLDDGKTTLLNRTSYAGWTWSNLQVSKGQIILQQDLQENYRSNIFLFDPSSGHLQALTDDGISYSPQMDSPWVIWRAKSGSQGKDLLHILNLQTRQSRTASLPGGDNSEPRLNGSLVYWSGAIDSLPSYFAIYILDLATNIVYFTPSPKPEVVYPEIVIRGKNIAWIREDIAGTPVGYLEWTTVK